MSRICSFINDGSFKNYHKRKKIAFRKTKSKFCLLCKKKRKCIINGETFIVVIYFYTIKLFTQGKKIIALTIYF